MCLYAPVAHTITGEDSPDSDTSLVFFDVRLDDSFVFFCETDLEELAVEEVTLDERVDCCCTTGGSKSTTLSTVARLRCWEDRPPRR